MKLVDKFVMVRLWVLITIVTLSCDTDRNIDPPTDSHFVKYFGTDENEAGVDMIILSDGNLLLLGKSQYGSKKIYLVKVDPDGNLIWEKYLGAGSDIAKDIEPTNDGNFVILSDYEASQNNIDIKIIKINPDGNKIDSVVYGSPGNENSRSITPLLDGGFIVTGSTEYTVVLPKPSNPNDVSDIFHFRCDAGFVFDTTWEDQYGPGTLDGAAKVFQKSDTEFYVFGYSNQPHLGSTGKTNLQYYLIGSGGLSNSSVNFLGDFAQDNQASHIMKAPPDFGGGYFLIATRISSAGLIGLRVSKLRSPLQFNAINDVQLDQDITVGTGAQSIISVSAAASTVSSPQGYLLLANEIRVNGTANISLSKIDQIGNLLWFVSLGSEEKNDLAAAVAELADGRIIVLGTVGIGDQTKMALFKLNSTGRLLK